MDNSQKTTIGKDVIESLTLGMYEDSRFIYREYVQNAADQIDKAVRLGLLSSEVPGEIWIQIDRHNRTVTIEDNATGIEASKVAEILRNIAKSTKERGIDKGFRGIGRLGGLGYCDTLIFETSYIGENVKSKMIWDAKELKNIINNRRGKEEATAVIDAVTTLSTEKELPERGYFKVTLKNVSNEILLDKHIIGDYLRMVAPVPFHPRFIYGAKIYDELRAENISIDEYKIYLNTDQVFKAHTTTIYEGDEKNKKRVDEITDIQFFQFKTQASELLLWGWYSISDFTKQIPEKGNLARGIRLRSGNIQIGSEQCLVKLHKEQRGNFYFFGEIHTFHPNLIPNARRDYFLENETAKLFESELRRFFAEELHKLYYFASNVRSEYKRITQLFNFKEEYEKKTQQGFTNNEELRSYDEKFEKLKEGAEQAQKKLERVAIELKGDETPKRKIFERLARKLPKQIEKVELPVNGNSHKPKFLTDDLTKLSRNDRKFLSRVFAVIDKVLTKETADNLKLKIKEEFE